MKVRPLPPLHLFVDIPSELFVPNSPALTEGEISMDGMARSPSMAAEDHGARLCLTARDNNERDT
jgi:hypothetical protein